MRFLRLDLLAFGPFTRKSLEFDPQIGLHIVLGPNEAGKSSSLRGVRSLLYGIPTQSPDDFVHAYQDMRIGGLLETASGTKCEWIRRKGRSKTLRGPDDIELIDESALNTWLGGIDESAFCQQFGIDYQTLRRGGESIVRGGGDLGEVLFAAGAGVADLHNIQQRLATEADALFKPRGSTQPIAKALANLKDINKQIKETELPTARWVEHDQALQQAEQRQREIDEELAAMRTQRNRLDRMGQSLPLIAKLKVLRSALKELADAPLLDEDFSADRREAESQWDHARQSETKAQREIERLEAQLSGVTLPDALLQHRTAISQLQTELGSYLKAAKDRPNRVASRDSALQHAQRLLQELNHPIPLEQADTLRLSRIKRKHIIDLAIECKALIEKQAACARSVRDLQTQLDQVQSEIARQSAVPDFSELERAINRALRQGDLDSDLRAADAEIAQLRQQAQILLAQLTRFQGALDDLERLSIPSIETIERFDGELHAADQAVRQSTDSVETLTKQWQTVQSQLDALCLEKDVPSEGDLTQARQRRDAGWELIQRVWRGDASSEEPAVAAFVSEFAPGADLAAAFRSNIERADAIADRLRREADRVARKANLMAELKQTESYLSSARQALQHALQTQERVTNQWRAEWSPAGVEPLSPREMRGWRNRQQELSRLAGEIRVRESSRLSLADQIKQQKDTLGKALKTLDCTELDDEHPLSMLLDRAQELAAAIRENNSQLEQWTRQRQQLQIELAQKEHEAEDASQALSRWQHDWTAAVAALGLTGDAQPSEVTAVIDTIDELIRSIDDANVYSSRISKMDRDADNFQHSVRGLLQTAAPDLLPILDQSVERAVSDVIDRLHQAEQDQAKVNAWLEQLEDQRRALLDANMQSARWRQKLEMMCQRAGCQSNTELPLVETRSKRRRETELELRGVEQRLVELAGGMPLEDWILTADPFDADHISVELVRLDQSLRQLESDRSAVSEAIGKHRNELSRMSGQGVAAAAQLEYEHVLAALRSDAEQYFRLRLAWSILTQAIERFRESNQGPVLLRAAQ
ncbi:MAG TPA: AAA family ATPase, partial [Pirellulaceae bacterium]|nr:AAA family ATPase [Pirellulaceae bacterium]